MADDPCATAATEPRWPQGRADTPCPRCGEVCKYDGWDTVHASGLGIGSCQPDTAALMPPCTCGMVPEPDLPHALHCAWHPARRRHRWVFGDIDPATGVNVVKCERCGVSQPLEGVDSHATIEGSRCANTPTPIRPPIEEANGHG